MKLIEDSPSHWKIVDITSIADINPTNPDNPPDDDELASFVPMKSIEELSGKMDPSEHKKWGEIKKGYTRFQENDIVFAKITPSMENGKSALARNLKNGVAAGTTELHVIRPSGDVIPKYILYFVLQEGFRREAEANMTGTAGQMRVPTEFVKSVEIPLPPYDEQKRIVSKIEEFLSKTDTSINYLKVSGEKLEKYRRSLLNSAVNGNLTDNWRNENGLLSDDRRKNIPEIDGEHEIEGELPDLPDGWKWAKFGDITVNYDSERDPISRSERSEMQGEYPYYGASGIIDHLNDYILDGEYLLISEDGANLESRTKPIAFIVEGKFWPNNHAHVVQAKYGIPLEYLEIYFESRSILDYLTGTAQPKMTQTNLNKIPVPVGPQNELEQIVERTERKLTVIESTMNEVKDAVKRSNRLNQAILKEAFQGKITASENTSVTRKKHDSSELTEQTTLPEVTRDAK